MSDSGDAASAAPGTGPPPTQRMRDVLSALVDGRGEEDGVGYYRTMCQAGLSVLPVRGVSLSLIMGDGLTTLLASSDAIAERIADLQFTAGDGPTADAYRAGAPVLEPMLDDRSISRWPGFAPTALEIGVRSLFVFPLQAGAIRFGVLCLDGDRPGMLLRSDLGDAVALADAALVSVLNHLADTPARAGWLEEVGGHMSVVHEATGMVMVQLATTAENALLRLRSHAFASGRTVTAVAADVVARRVSFESVD